MENKENLLELTLTILAIGLTLIFPVPLTQEYRLAIIGSLLIFYITISLFRFNRRLSYNEEEINRLEEKLKIYERLVRIEEKIKSFKKR